MLIKTSMKLPFRLLFIAMVQVVITSVITYFLVMGEYRSLSQQSLETLERFLIEQKQQELKNYTDIALSAVNDAYENSGSTDLQAKAQVAQILDQLLYSGDDGYFFVYDGNGNNITHPKEPFRVGNNYWELEDNNGEKIIQILVENAKAGGGFYRYPWQKPSINQTEEKMGYSAYLSKWNWMLGTGVYLDDVNAQLNKLQSEINQHIKKTREIILTVAISSIVLIFILGLLVNLSQKKRTDLKISELGQRIINLQEEERRRLSRDLHDGIVQILVSVKYSLEATRMTLKRDHIELPEPLSHGEHNLKTAISEIRRMSHNLHPRILDELGLSAAIHALAAEFTERTGIVVNVIKPAARKLLPDHISTTLYRVVQESLVNIEKHAKASRVDIVLVLENTGLSLTISDDGQGFSNTSPENPIDFGIGLRNLSERVEYHEGKFEIHSSFKGTSIIASIPTSSFVNHFNRTNIKAAQ